MTLRTFLTTLVFAGLVSGVITTTSVPAFAAASRTDQLTTMNETLAAMDTRWQAHQRQVEQQLKDMDEMLKGIRRNQAELLLKVNELATTVSVADGRVSENVNALQDIIQRLTTLNNRLDLLTRHVAGDAFVEESQAVAANPQVMFDQAREDFLKQRYDMAISGFQAFLKEYPGDGRAMEAQYWIAESYYSQGKYQDAIVEFRKVAMSPTPGEKSGDALLKIGLAQYSLKNYRDAASIFEEVVSKYPNTPLARIAAERLKLTEGKR